MKLKRLASAISLTTVLALTMTACAAPESAQQNGAATVMKSNTTAAAAGPLDSATWIIGNEPASTDMDDPASNSQSDIVMSNVCERLVQLGTDLTIHPNLATDWTWKSDSELVFNLRDDVTFHNGDPMTVDDVVWSMRRHMDDGAEKSDKFASVRGVRKTGDHQITFDMKQRDGIFATALAGGAGAVVSKKMVDEQGDDYGTATGTDACTGPFTFDSWAPGKNIVLKKAENYWNEERTAKTNTVTITWGEDDADVNSLLSGQVDGAYLENLASASRLAADSKLNVVQGEDTRVWNLMATNRGGLTDPRLREALSLVLDRPGINEAAFSGNAKLTTEPVDSGVWTYEKDTFKAAADTMEFTPLEVTNENIEKAENLVDEVGDTQEIVVATDGETVRTAIAEAVVTAAETIGLKAKLLRIPSASYGDFYSDAEVRKKADLYADDSFVSTYDPLGFYSFGKSDASNQWVMRDKKYDAMVEDAIAQTDDAKRAEKSIKVAQYWNREQPWITAVATPNIVVFDKDVTGVPAAGNFRYYPWAADLGAAE